MSITALDGQRTKIIIKDYYSRSDLLTFTTGHTELQRKGVQQVNSIVLEENYKLKHSDTHTGKIAEDNVLQKGFLLDEADSCSPDL